ncbi:MAG: hypothetical protein HOM96_05360 [Rickettsiales bacterium]|nr:hypothetical protein [Rickettsiales bacterium]
MYDFDAIKRIVDILQSVRIEKKITISDVQCATNIAVRRIKQIESCDKDFYLNNKTLFIRYCRTYQKFLKIEDNEDFDRIRENSFAYHDKEIIDSEKSKRPSIDNLELAIFMALLCWIFIGVTNLNRENKVVQQIPDDKIIYFEDLNK